MKKTDQYQINTSNIIHEIIDGEAIIVNMEKGHYYSLRSTGAEIWACIVRGMSIEEMINKFADQYDMEWEEIKTAVENLISELRSEDMVIPLPSGNGSENPLEEEEQAINETKLHKFEIPVLEKYTDMEELLLLDPIHEVDQTGWPKISSGAVEEGMQIE